MWLTLPVGKKDFRSASINEIKIKDNEIFDKHCKTIKMTYARAPHFDEEVCKLVDIGHESLAEHNTFLIRFFLNRLGINPKLICASELNIPIRAGTEGIIDIVKALDGVEYISGLGAKTYINEELFKEESIGISYIAYKPIVYSQIHPGFVENMSAIDAVFNLGWRETSLKLKNVKTLSTVKV